MRKEVVVEEGDKKVTRVKSMNQFPKNSINLINLNSYCWASEHSLKTSIRVSINVILKYVKVICIIDKRLY